MRIEEDVKLDFCDVLIRPKRSALSSRSEAVLHRELKWKIRYSVDSYKHWDGVPICVANMGTTGTFAMAKAMAKHNMMVALHKHYTREQLVDFFTNNPDISQYVFFTIGMDRYRQDLEKLIMVKSDLLEWTEKESKKTGPHPAGFDESWPPLLMIDVANGYQEDVCSYLEEEIIEQYRFGSSIIACGNVATPEMTEQLILSGANIVKVGVGSGRVCTTRLVAGVGVPQLSAVMECADAAHGLGARIMSDGGIVYPADVAKAFGGGADFVMIGSLFAGVDECDGDWTYAGGGKKSLCHFGMSSNEAMERYNGGKKDYVASEGRVIEVPYKGCADDVVQQILGGLRSACSYSGASTLKDLPKCCTFIKVARPHSDMSLEGSS